MSNYVPNYEDRYYEVHPSQLRWAMSQLGAVPGYNVLGYAHGPGGMYIIVVQVPVGAERDWRAPVQQRRRWFRLDGVRLTRGLALAVVAVALAYIAYSIFVDGLPQTTSLVAQATPEPSLWDLITGTNLAQTAAPVVEMPWDAAGRQVGDAIDGIGRILTLLVALLLLGAVAWVVAKVRGALGK